VERELLMTGIGGQGVQLAAQLTARAALAGGRQVMLFGSYGGMMRGGNTEATLVVSDRRVESPPTVVDAWSAIVMHPAYADPLRARLHPDGLIVLNATTVPPADWPASAIAVPAGQVAVELGTPAAVSMVALGAYAAATGLVDLEHLIAALPDALPPYRAQHLPANETALRAGYALVPQKVHDAWAA
jgi:Pyruvate/2-oxoacid:ferredoxin oxidoreductase gamma subunit